jgi:DNA-binding PucR family transcriptional regulator
LRHADVSLLDTTTSFLEHGGSIEGTARDLIVHPNTVRYRLRRVGELTGYWPQNPRDAFTLRLGLLLGRLESV